MSELCTMEGEGVCIICCTTLLDEDDVDTSVCSKPLLQRFLTVLERQFRRRIKTADKISKIQDDTCKLTCCTACLGVMDSFCDFYHQMKCLELKLIWRLKTIKGQMKLGGQVSERVSILKQVCAKLDREKASRNCSNRPCQESSGNPNTYRVVKDFRRELLRKCSPPSCSLVPKVVLCRAPATPTTSQAVSNVSSSPSTVVSPSTSTVVSPSTVDKPVSDGAHWSSNELRQSNAVTDEIGAANQGQELFRAPFPVVSSPRPCDTDLNSPPTTQGLPYVQTQLTPPVPSPIVEDEEVGFEFGMSDDTASVAFVWAGSSIKILDEIDITKSDSDDGCDESLHNAANETPGANHTELAATATSQSMTNPVAVAPTSTLIMDTATSQPAPLPVYRIPRISRCSSVQDTRPPSVPSSPNQRQATNDQRQNSVSAFDITLSEDEDVVVVPGGNHKAGAVSETQTAQNRSTASRHSQHENLRNQRLWVPPASPRTETCPPRYSRAVESLLNSIPDVKVRKVTRPIVPPPASRVPTSSFTFRVPAPLSSLPNIVPATRRVGLSKGQRKRQARRNRINQLTRERMARLDRRRTPSPSKAPVRSRSPLPSSSSAFGGTNNWKDKMSQAEFKRIETIARKEDFMGPPDMSMLTLNSPLQSFLQKQFSNIVCAMEVPEHEYSMAVTLAKNVQSIFQDEYPTGRKEIFRATPFRHMLLKLRNTCHTAKSEILIFCWNMKLESINKVNFSTEFQAVGVAELRRKCFSSEKAKQSLSNATISYASTSHSFTERDALNLQIRGEQYGIQLQYYLSLVSNPAILIEVQLGKLLQYMCTFDARMLPLITLVRYWSNVNNISVGGTNSMSYPGVRIPEPAALDWLVVGWMASRGLVPTPRLLLNRPHSRLPIYFRGYNLDIGFSQDAEFAQQWMKNHKTYPDCGSEIFPQNVLQLAQDFFEAHTNFKSGNFLVNTRDAENIPMELFTPKHNNTAFCNSKLQTWEIQILREKKFDPDNSVSFRSTRVHITNPLTVLSSLDVHNFANEPGEFVRICYIMEHTGHQLRNLLNAVAWQSYTFDLAETLKVQL